MPNSSFSAEFRRQDHFRLHSLAGLNIGAEFERQPTLGFFQQGPNLGAEFRLQNLSFRGRGGGDPLPRVPASTVSQFRFLLSLNLEKHVT